MAEGKMTKACIRLGAILAAMGLAGMASAVTITVEPEASREQVKVEIVEKSASREVWVTAGEKTPLSFVRLTWPQAFPQGAVARGDAWERSYGELGWRPLDFSRVMPWYCFVASGSDHEAFGVAVQPNALACWRAGDGKVELQLDLRCGGAPVELGGRRLLACQIVHARRTDPKEDEFDFARRFCWAMMDAAAVKTRLILPVYGYNDWYAAYGRNTAANYLADLRAMQPFFKGLANRPFAVMDDGWQPKMRHIFRWDGSTPAFGMAMDKFASEIKALGFRPGLWYRPLLPRSVLQATRRIKGQNGLDPSDPELLACVRREMKAFRAWGFELIKIDYLTNEFVNRWGPDFGDRLVTHREGFQARDRTTAEIVKNLYRTLREAAGEDAVLIGCNAIGHLCAGIFDVQRIGDDTSGREWARTLRMGVNTLGFRAEQHNIFFQADADCVGLTKRGAVPWNLNCQWLELVARSGTPLFVSWRRADIDDEVAKAFGTYFPLAAQATEVGRPLDARETNRPRRWRFKDGTRTFDWNAAPRR